MGEGHPCTIETGAGSLPRCDWGFRYGSECAYTTPGWLPPTRLTWLQESETVSIARDRVIGPLLSIYVLFLVRVSQGLLRVEVEEKARQEGRYVLEMRQVPPPNREARGGTDTAATRLWMKRG